MRAAPMLEQVDALPGAEREPALEHGNDQAHLSERGAQMRGHVIGSLLIVRIALRILRRELLEETLEVGAHLGCGVFLDQERCGGVRAKDVEQSARDPPSLEPARDLAGDLDETPPSGSYREHVRRHDHGPPAQRCRSSTQRTSSGTSTGSMSRLTTSPCWPLRASTQCNCSSSLALISWCGT